MEDDLIELIERDCFGWKYNKTVKSDYLENIDDIRHRALHNGDSVAFDNINYYYIHYIDLIRMKKIESLYD